MATIYLIVLGGVCVALLASLVEVVLSLSRQPDWAVPQARLTLVETEDRRHLALPFVGAERRQPPAGLEAEAEAERLRA